MKRKIIKGIFAVVVILCLSILFGQIVLAHPGGTDEYGGHYDRETGWYHYHHGYPPHSHKDGVCPYDFDDKTGWNSGASSGSSSKTTTNPPVTTTRTPSATVSTTGPVWDPYLRPNRQPTTTAEQTEDKNDTATVVIFVILCIICVIPLFFAILIIYKTKKSEREYEQYKAEVAAAELQKRNRLSLLKRLGSDAIFSELADPLQAVSFDDGLQIIYKNRTPDRFYGDYTVYKTTSGKKYHKKKGCCGATIQLPAFQKSEDYFFAFMLCSKCWHESFETINDTLFSPYWYTQYQQLQYEMQRYHITADDIRTYRKEQKEKGK